MTFFFGVVTSTCSSPEDDNGHGTHVAGTAAALDNDIGVVGVAPGARLYAVKVLGKNGSGTLSAVIKGIDWVTQNAGALKIKVANMSLGASGSDDGNCGRSNNDPLHTAICNSVAAGVTYVVSAGNSGADAKNTIPAAYSEAITVTALADTDGKPGGFGPVSTYGGDDTFATFSNYGPGVDLIAPGVSILSTYLNGGYATLSGTSMAAPHVTGAAALYIAQQNPGASPQQVRQALISQGKPGPWSGDRDAIAEPLVYVGALHDVAVTAISASASTWVLTNDPVTLEITVANTGTFQETATLTLTDQTTVPATAVGGPIDIPPLEPGASITTTVQWTATLPIGLHTILGQVSLVATAGVEDANTANDAKSVTIEVKNPLHDVAVTALTAPASAITGQAVTVTGTVANLGTYNETLFNVTLTDTGAAQVAGSPTAVTLPAGSSIALTFTWTPTSASSHTLAATAVLAVEEVVNQANNAKQVTIAVADSFADASVTALTAPTSAITGQAVTVTGTVANLGNVAASFTVSLTDNGALVGSPIAVSSLPAGGSKNLTFTWTPPSASSHTLEARTVVAGDTNAGNDFKTATVAVSDVQLLAVTVTTNKPSYSFGQTVTITTLVTGNGGVPVSGASVQVVIKGANGRTTSKSGTTSASGTFVLNWGTSSYTPFLYGRGPYTVNATATKSGYQSGSGATTSFILQ